MAEQEFGPDRDLLVVADEHTVGFITRGHDREDLDHDEVRKLIAFLQVIVGEGLPVEQLDAMETDDRVVDCDGDIWTRESDGRWGGAVFYRSITASEVVNKYGPVRKVG